MKKIQLGFEDFEEENFGIIAIYSDEMDYRLAYLLNKNQSILLIKSESLFIIKDKVEFSIFEYDDPAQNRKWILLNNYTILEKEVANTLNLFGEPTLFTQKKIHIKAYKRAKYILKIVSDDAETFSKYLVENLKKIPQIYTAEIIDTQKIKNKKLLIF